MIIHKESGFLEFDKLKAINYLEQEQQKILKPRISNTIQYDKTSVLSPKDEKFYKDLEFQYGQIKKQVQKH